MDASISSFAPHFVALLSGGLVGSLGPTWWARSEKAGGSLGALGTRSFAATLSVLGVVAVVAAYAVGRSVADVALIDPSAIHPLGLFLLGLSVGVPLGLPGLVAARADARRRLQAAIKRRDHVPTREERRAFAARLVDQIREVSPRPRTVTAEVTGDGGRVLRFDGEIDAKEGERLTRALKADLREVGFKRVEGRHGDEEWWSRV